MIAGVGLIREGGGMRTTYTGGVLGAFMDAGGDLGYVVGVSAGAIAGGFYVAGQRERGHRVFVDLVADPRYAVVLTRNAGYRKPPARFRGLGRVLLRRYPALYAAMLRRPAACNASLDLVERMERAGSAFVLRPFRPLVAGRMERDLPLRRDALAPRNPSAGRLHPPPPGGSHRRSAH